MLTQPQLEDRAAQPYVAIPVRVPMTDIGNVVPPLIPEVLDWVARNGIAPAGPPFFRFVVINMAGNLEIEAGVPTATTIEGDDRLRAGSLPAGRYATALHTGPPDDLVNATADLLAWAEANGIVWQVAESPDGEVWGARVEFYLTDPRDAPDMATWQTQLAFLTVNA